MRNRQPDTNVALVWSAAFLVSLVVGCSDSDGGSGLIDRGQCDELIECAAALAPESEAQYVLTYGPTGTCWAGGAAQWQFCRDSCAMAIDALNQVGMITGESCDDIVGDAETGDGGDGDGESTTGDGDGESSTEGGCYPQPEECARLIECLDTIAPGEDLSMYEEGGSCWCGTEQEAIDCQFTCIDQLDAAISTNYMGAATVGVCHGRYCPLEDLDPDEPYGPPPCGAGETLLDDLSVPGSYCAPACVGLAATCPQHSQTIAQGTCLFNGDPDLCGLYCYVDPFIYPAGTQCHCGATCQPTGAPDGDGNPRGVCTFE